MTVRFCYYSDGHCERSPAPHGVQGEAKQSLILDSTEFFYFLFGTYRQFGKVLAVCFHKEYEIKTLFSKGLSKNIFALGSTSFLTDVSREMIYPLLPLYLRSVLGASTAFVGLVEGIAESTSSVLNIVSGWLSDKIQKRKTFLLFIPAKTS
jgi:hypothetical protein